MDYVHLIDPDSLSCSEALFHLHVSLVTSHIMYIHETGNRSQKVTKVNPKLLKDNSTSLKGNDVSESVIIGVCFNSNTTK